MTRRYSPALYAALRAVEANAAAERAQMTPDDSRKITDTDAMNAALFAVRVMQPLT